MSFQIKKIPWRGTLGVLLVTVFWELNWSLKGLRTEWAFFPLWLGYCLVVDSLVFMRTSTSLFSRSWKRYIAIFLASSLVWWLFELANARLQNWTYLGAEEFSRPVFSLWATLNFSVVIPAVFGTAELMRSFLPSRMSGPVIRSDKVTTTCFFLAGWIMLGIMIAWPKIFFPFLWISLFFILEPLNIWLGNRSLTEWTGKGNWQPVVALWMGVLVTGFFWEMWNYYSYPKWIYHVPWGNWLHIFEMPLLGYGGYLPFALELFSTVHLLAGLMGCKKTRYVLEKEDHA